jgi:hypothetical protein
MMEVLDYSPPTSTGMSPSIGHSTSAVPTGSDALKGTKKLKLSAQGGSMASRASTGSKKAVKEAASTAALMNLQGTINRLTDSLTTTFSVTDESRISDDRARALQVMQEEEGLSNEDKLVLMHAFMRSPPVCGTYLQIASPDLHLSFLQSVVRQAKENITI